MRIAINIIRGVSLVLLFVFVSTWLLHNLNKGEAYDLRLGQFWQMCRIVLLVCALVLFLVQRLGMQPVRKIFSYCGIAVANVSAFLCYFFWIHSLDTFHENLFGAFLNLATGVLLLSDMIVHQQEDYPADFEEIE